MKHKSGMKSIIMTKEIIKVYFISLFKSVNYRSSIVKAL